MCAECYLSVPGVIHLLSLFFVEKCTLKNGCKDSYSCDLWVTSLFLHTEGWELVHNVMFVFQELSCFVSRAYEVVKNVVQQLSSLYTR